MRRAEKPVVTCVHHWRIAEPAGEWAEGVCGSCGAQRRFANAHALDRVAGGWSAAGAARMREQGVGDGVD